jgi:hypothetical protein
MADLFADIDSLESFIENLPTIIAEEYHRRLINNIQTNKFGFSNKASTLVRKTGDTPLIDTGAYINAIKLDGALVYVDYGTEERTGISFALLSNVLEFGRLDKSIPAYPVWRLTYDELLEELNTFIESKRKEWTM